jgi:ribokinase
MSRIFVAGLINIETTLAVDGFPLPYFPVHYPFFGVQTTVSGAGFNLAKALKTLGDQVDLASLIGADDNGSLARAALDDAGIPDDLVLNPLRETAQSVILYDPAGHRQIHSDLKDIQDHDYPVGQPVRDALSRCDIAVISNANFTRPLLGTARDAGKPIATDVHALSDLKDDFNREFLQYADILFLSDEALPELPEDTARRLMDLYGTGVVVIGLGERGALLAVRNKGIVEHFPAVHTRPVVNTIGAGDALFSAFLSRYLHTQDAVRALRAALVFASYKIGEKGAASGFLTGEALDEWLKKIYKE